MPFFVSTHRKVIAYIHLGFRERPFAIHEVRSGSGVSNSSVTRTMQKLVDLKLLKHSENKHQGRNYEVTRLWDNDVMKVIEVYEYAKVLGI